MAEIEIARRDGADEPVAAARAEIEQTRARMSETIEEIERVLLHRKERVRERLDVLAPVRERPLASLGAAFGVALLLGLLTGGDDGGSEPNDRGWKERSDTWEARSRRLLDIAKAQSEEIRELREDVGELRSEALEERHARERSERESAGPSWRDRLAETLTGFIGDTLQQLARRL
ncbi:MAG: hypothetical protein ACR2F9_04505 [Longimicrobiaceae bacterium]